MGKRLGRALLGVVLLGVGLLPASAAATESGDGTKYYVDAVHGSDDAKGTSPGRAWRTLRKVNETTFEPGDQILLRAGQSWGGQLWPKGSGATRRPITIDKYGPGAKPAIHGAGEVAETVRLFNQHDWEIRNLEVTNTRPLTGEPGTNLRDLRGIQVAGDIGGTLSHFVIDSVDVHDVTGEVNWIGGDAAGNKPGVTFQTGWDRSKNTGGIVFRGTVADIAAPGTATVLNDILVENSSVKRTSFAGIVVKQHTGSSEGAVKTGWGERANATDPRFTPHTNVVIRNNFIQQDGSDYACNGMYLTDLRGGLVEGNVVYRAGTSGIEAYYADDVVIQHNEVYETQQKAGGADSNAIDPDKATTRILVQYNFVHHNGDGILICQFSFGDTVIRYNTIARNSRYQIYLHSDRAATAKIYNNTIYSDRSDHLIYGYGSSLNATYDIRNNILYSTRANASLTTSPTITYDNNLYGGASLVVPQSDGRPVLGDPLFTAALTGPYGTEASGPQLDRALALVPSSGSVAVGTGVAVADNGGRDYAGTALYRGLPDLGAFEYRTPQRQNWESINGFVRDQFGHPVEGAAVVVETPGRIYSASTQAGGFYRIEGLPFETAAAIRASKDGYDAGSATVVVHRGDTTRQDLTIDLQDTDGSIAGRVLDQRAAALAGAVVTVRSGGEVIGSARSGADGGFVVPDVPMGSGYTVVAELEGRQAVERAGISVLPAAAADAGAFLLASAREDLQVHEFDDLPIGAFPNGSGGWTVSSTGNAVDVVEVPSASDRSVRLTRTANTGGTAGTGVSQVFATPLRGLVTVQARVMRDQPYVSGSNWFGLPYLYNASGGAAVSLAFDKGNIIAYEGSTSRTVASYELGRWYDVRLVVDTVNERFDLYLDGTRISDGQPFRTAMPAVAGIAFYANSSNYGSAYVDDVRISYGI
ncbi:MULTISPECIES: carboxypeptidase regulatory-like domain-containing protein [unclassified Kribbella]|uniref:carboxypeptidase regulatory-like domain-containing protein n=1 Tax=unclassified Kribbella TaxID=2644121 RepID=UPI00301808A8